MQFASSAAHSQLSCNCQLSCTLSVQMNLSYQLNVLLELSAFSLVSLDLPGCTLSAPLYFISLTIIHVFGRSVSAWARYVSSGAVCQLSCHLFTCWVNPTCQLDCQLSCSSANCNSDVICHLLSNSSSQLQVVCSAASCSFCVIRHISYNYLCSSAKRNGLYIHTLCPGRVQLSDVHDNKASTIELDHLMVKYAADSLLHLTRDTKPVTDVHSPKDHFCRLCQAIVCRDELTAELK